MSDWASRKTMEILECDDEGCLPHNQLHRRIAKAIREAYDQGLHDALEAKQSKQEPQAYEQANRGTQKICPCGAWNHDEHTAACGLSNQEGGANETG